MVLLAVKRQGYFSLPKDTLGSSGCSLLSHRKAKMKPKVGQEVAQKISKNDQAGANKKQVIALLALKWATRLYS